MSVYVRTQNVTDATVQVHIAFENAQLNQKSRRRRATRSFNTAELRGAKPLTLTTGRNKAEHRSSAKSKRSRLARQAPKQLPAPSARSPA